MTTNTPIYLTSWLGQPPAASAATTGSASSTIRPAPSTALEQLQQLREAQAQAKLDRITRAREFASRAVQTPFLEDNRTKAQRLTEDTQLANDFWLVSYIDLLDRYRDGFINSYPITSPADRMHGHNWPFWASEQQLSLLRAQARLLAQVHPNAIGLLNGFRSYVIHTGFNYQAVARKGKSPKVAARAQEILDDFHKETQWWQTEREFFYRSRRDGEAFLRVFDGGGKITTRFIEPEQVFQPPNSAAAEWSYGIKNPPDDVCKPLAYYVSYYAPMGKGKADAEGLGEVVDAKHVIHHKCNVDGNVKRGLTDFSYDTLDLFSAAGRVRKNLLEGAAVQAAIAAIRQHAEADPNAIADFVDSQIEYTAATGDGRTVNYRRLEPGTFLDIDKGQTYVEPPGAANTPAYIEAMQAALRNAGNRINAPEWLATSDASNTVFASSLTAESPFVKSCEAEQRAYSVPFLKVMHAVLDLAAKRGLLPRNWRDHFEVNVVPPKVEARDKGVEAQVNGEYIAAGVKSKQTAAHELGLDWDKERKNMQEERPAQPEGGPKPGDPSAGGDQQKQPPHPNDVVNHLLGEAWLREARVRITVRGGNADFDADAIRRDATGHGFFVMVHPRVGGQHVWQLQVEGRNAAALRDWVDGQWAFWSHMPRQEWVVHFSDVKESVGRRPLREDGTFKDKLGRVYRVVNGVRVAMTHADDAVDKTPIAGTVYKGVKKALHAAHKVFMGAQHAVQHLAVQAARERGLDEKKVKHLATTLAIADFAGGYVVGGAVAATVGPLAGKAASFAPNASLMYLGYSTAKNPKATLRAARKLILGDKKSDATPEWVESDTAKPSRHPAFRRAMAELFKAAKDPHWAEALFVTALDRHPERPLRAAKVALRYAKKHPRCPQPEKADA